MRTIFLFLLLTACGSTPQSSSHPSSLFGALDLVLLPESTARATASALGALLVQLHDPTSNQTFALPTCSGIQLSRRHVLTAGHCDRTNYVFSKNYIAAPTDLTSFQVSTIGPDVNLVFTGAMIPAEAADETQSPTTTAAVWKDTTLDAAVLEFPHDLPAGWIDLFAADLPVSGLVHYGFPNGMPLASSTSCHRVPAADGAHFQHDCDSLGGSSGGLLVDSALGFPAGMQLAGPGVNLSSYYLANGHFETPEDFAARRGCTRDAFPDPTAFATCVRDRGLNTAVKLSAVAAAVITQDPELYARILEAGDVDSM
jgi:V8-like Glu-specific endopeptidase